MKPWFRIHGDWWRKAKRGGASSTEAFMRLVGVCARCGGVGYNEGFVLLGLLERTLKRERRHKNARTWKKAG